jgi:predicted enzyme related to lactoylglutathione lyase
MPNVLFAGVATADLEAAVGWYELLLGRPPEVLVNDDEVMWRICDGGWLYVVRDPQRAGHALVALAVPDLDEAIAQIEQRGLSRPPVETIPDAARKARFLDPEGNTVALIEVAAPKH